MSTERTNDLRAFKSFIDEQLQIAGGGKLPTLDEALALWEVDNQTDDDQAATVEAVREALNDMRTGDTGMPAREAISELRRKHNLP